MLGNLRISSKIYVLISTLIFFMVLTVGTGIFQMIKIGAEIASIAEEDMPATAALTQVTIHQLEQAILFERSIGLAARLKDDKSLLSELTSSKAGFIDLGHKVEKELKDIELMAKAVVAHSTSDVEIAEFNKIATEIIALETKHSIYEKEAEALLEQIANGDLKGTTSKIHEIEAIETALDHELEALLFEIERFTEDALLQAEHHEQTALYLLIGLFAFTATASVALSWLIVRQIVPPIITITNVMTSLADGNYDAEVPVLSGQDEVAQMARAVQIFKDAAMERKVLQATLEKEKTKAAAQELEASVERDRLVREAKEREVIVSAETRKKFVETISVEFENRFGSSVSSVASGASQMSAISKGLADSANDTSDQSKSVANASEQANSKVQAVAAAAEELSASISEITRQVSESSTMTTDAVEEAKVSHSAVQSLVTAAVEIGDVVNLIADIAEQTNLLALNATIEAARAGEAGKGFAVVASEVKNLATQTARATEEIGSRISDIQKSTESAAASIEGIGDIIGKVDGIASDIAHAMDQQSAATQEIARNVEQAVSGTDEVSNSISSIAKASAETGQVAAEIRDVSQSLTDQSAMLTKEVGNFLDNLKSGAI
ncbi:MAG: methyl-accepting chemotaxis protein [Sneathiella sp.]